MNRFVPAIVAILKQKKGELAVDFKKNAEDVGTRFFVIDDFLSPQLAREIYDAFPKEASAWRQMKTFREKKFTSKNLDKLPAILSEITFAIQDPQVIQIVEEITGINQQYADQSLYAGGLSMMTAGHFLNPHVDNSHDQNRKMYRRLNLLYYVTPDWKLEDGGHLELWDVDVKKRKLIESRFNRLIVMETDHKSWHSVCEVKRSDGFRCCVSNYYFSPVSPLDHEYFHITAFKGRPDEHFKRWVSGIDTFLRTTVRKFKKSGLGRQDIYNGKPQ